MSNNERKIQHHFIFWRRCCPGAAALVLFPGTRTSPLGYAILWVKWICKGKHRHRKMLSTSITARPVSGTALKAVWIFTSVKSFFFRGGKKTSPASLRYSQSLPGLCSAGPEVCCWTVEHWRLIWKWTRSRWSDAGQMFLCHNATGSMYLLLTFTELMSHENQHQLSQQDQRFRHEIIKSHLRLFVRFIVKFS